MAEFNWNQLYTLIKSKLEKETVCTVGRYVTPKASQFPYVDVSLADNSGGHYDLEGAEGSQNPLIVLTVYCNGASGDSKCYSISEKAKELMLSYGFHCRGGPIKVDNADLGVARWIGRYQRVIGNGDELTQIN